jgi:predicted Zn-dependent protease
MQKATSISDSGIPAYVRTHPLSLERAADMQNRIREQVPGKLSTSIDFYLVQVLAKIEQQGGPQKYRIQSNIFVKNRLVQDL